MPRYFFHLTDDDNLSLADDELGEEFDLVEVARGHAVAVARELSRNQLSHALVGLYISVVDERGVVVFKMSLQARGLGPHETMQPPVNIEIERRDDKAERAYQSSVCVFPMSSDRIIADGIKVAQDLLRQNLPPTHNLTDAGVVLRFRELVRSQAIRSALERSSDTVLAFALREVERLLCDQSRPHRETINFLLLRQALQLSRHVQHSGPLVRWCAPPADSPAQAADNVPPCLS